jgi:predicted alpha/beta hydrolase family esterase
MGYLAHRGWDSRAPSFLEGDICMPADRVAWLVAHCRSLPAPPVVVAHDAGVHLAIQLAASIQLPAVVAVTPLLTRRDAAPAGLFAWPRLWRARLFGATVAPPNGFRRAAGLDAADELRADSAALFRELASAALPRPLAPSLLVGSSGDSLTDADALERLGRERGWAFLRHAGRGHFPMVDPGWERLADDVHRWLVQTLGEALLTLPDDDAAGE